MGNSDKRRSAPDALLKKHTSDTGGQPTNSRRAKLFPSIVQSVLTSAFILAAFSVSNALNSGLLVASLGPSAFIAFTFPKAESAKIRYFIGGYIAAAVWGVIFAFIRQHTPAIDEPCSTLLYCMLCVLLTSLCMDYFDVEHPPSVALAITLVISERPVAMAVTALISIVILSILRILFIRIVQRRERGIDPNSPPG